MHIPSANVINARNVSRSDPEDTVISFKKSLKLGEGEYFTDELYFVIAWTLVVNASPRRVAVCRITLTFRERVSAQKLSITNNC
jgi:hypothetical protein